MSSCNAPCCFCDTELEPPDVDDENADLSDAESEFEDATSAKLLSKKQQVSPCMGCALILLV